jgi:hypothetical protein
VEVIPNRFNDVVGKKLGCGDTIDFWKDIWVGEESLEQRFPRLFSISVQQNNVIRQMGSWTNGMWRWELHWRRNFLPWEEPLFHDLENVINNVVLREVEDSWLWKPNVEEGFTVKSLYGYLHKELLPQDTLSPFAQFAFKNVWRSAVPSKVSALAW